MPNVTLDLAGTTRDNGCLRVVPGSHLRYNPLPDRHRAPV